MSDQPPIDVKGLGDVLRQPGSPFRVSFAVVSVIGTVNADGESTVTVKVGVPPEEISYPFLRYAETPTPLAVNDKVLLVWIGTDPHVAYRLVP